MNKIEMLEREQMRMDIPDFITGDTVKVHVKIKEGEKERIQAFQGVVISRRKGTMGATFTVRKVSYGVGVERSSRCTHRRSIEWKSSRTAGYDAASSTTCAISEGRRRASVRDAWSDEACRRPNLGH